MQRRLSTLSCLTWVSAAAPWKSFPVWAATFLLQFAFNMWVFNSISKSLSIPNLGYSRVSLIPSESIQNELWSGCLFCLICHFVFTLILPLLLPCNQLLWKQYIVPRVSLEKHSPTMHPQINPVLATWCLKHYSLLRASARGTHLEPAQDYWFLSILSQALHVHWNATWSSHLSRLSGWHARERLPRSRSGVYPAYGSSVPHSSKRRR